MKIRLHGTRDEVGQAAERLHEVFAITETSRIYADRPPSQLVRVYIDIRL